MRKMETHRGTAELVRKLENETFYKLCRRICITENYHLDKWVHDFVELLRLEGYKKYIIVNENVYKLNDEKLDYLDEPSSIVKNEYDSYDYCVQFDVMKISLAGFLEEGIERLINKESEEDK